MTERFDAAIVGGGPAGALVARSLAQRGWRTVLLERAKRDRNKTCGHCLAARAFPFLRDAGLLWRVRAIASGRTQRLRVHDRNGLRMNAEIAGSSEGDDAAGLIVPRDRFDQLLRDAAAEAGAEVWHEAAARVVEISEDHTTLRVRRESHAQQIECRLLIGADGVGSAIARVGGLADSSAAGRKFGFAFDVQASAGDLDAIERGGIEMFLAPGGYLGLVRQNDDTLHAAALVSASANGKNADPASFIERVAKLHPAVRAALGESCGESARRSASGGFLAIGPMPWRPHGVCVNNIALTGDAAGYIEPFTGEGMVWALHSASLLAHAIESSSGAWNATARDMYASMWSDEIHRRQRVCRCLASTLERPFVSRWMLRAGRAMPALTRRLVREVVSA